MERFFRSLKNEWMPVVGYPQTNRKTDTGETLTRWPVLVDHYRDWEWLEKAPVIKIPQVRNKRVRWLEPEEAERLINECLESLK